MEFPEAGEALFSARKKTRHHASRPSFFLRPRLLCLRYLDGLPRREEQKQRQVLPGLLLPPPGLRRTTRLAEAIPALISMWHNAVDQRRRRGDVKVSTPRPDPNTISWAMTSQATATAP